jgi:Tol biopolymer transport system component
VNIWRVEVAVPNGRISSPMKLISSTRFDGDAQFSPDGKRVAFCSDRTGRDEVWMCDSDGLNAVRLTSLGIGSTTSVSWSPDGQQIALSWNPEGQWDIYITNVNGAKPKRLTSGPATDVCTSWSRDGRWIYFASDRSGEYQVWKIPAGGGEATQLTRRGGYQAIESPDSQWVYYVKSADDFTSLWKVPREGGEETQVLESVFGQSFVIVNEGIYFIPRPDHAGRSSLQFFNFVTKKIRSITTIEMPAGYFLSISPDGRWILYSQNDQTGSDLMLVENFR